MLDDQAAMGYMKAVIECKLLSSMKVRHPCCRLVAWPSKSRREGVQVASGCQPTLAPSLAAASPVPPHNTEVAHDTEVGNDKGDLPDSPDTETSSRQLTQDGHHPCAPCPTTAAATRAHIATKWFITLKNLSLVYVVRRTTTRPGTSIAVSILVNLLT